MKNVRTMPDKIVPIQLRDSLPWDKMRTCIVIFDNPDGSTGISISNMEWKDRVWLTHQLNLLNIIDGHDTVLV